MVRKVNLYLLAVERAPAAPPLHKNCIFLHQTERIRSEQACSARL